LPGTHLAHMAQLRINQLPHNQQELRELRNPRPIPVPEHFNLPMAARPIATSGSRSRLAKSELDKQKAAGLANACVERLTLEPNDVPTREELARLLAEHLNQADPGLEQLALLLNMPDQPDAKRAEWLNLMAAWHIHYRHDLITGREILSRLVHDFPQSPEAAAARRGAQTLDVKYRG
jgi:hypothetical protein